MTDEIKIKVGLNSSIKADMDRIVRDIDHGMSKAGSGRGFKEIFGKALSGDISGAMEELQQRVGKGWIGSAAVWGAGISTALLAGWKAGGAIDDMLGISDKVAKAWNAAAVEAGKGWDEFYKKLRAKRMDAEADLKASIDVDAKVFEMKEKRALGKMTGREKVGYLESGLPAAEAAPGATGISYDERSKRILDLEQLRGDIEDARKQAQAEEAAQVKADYDERIAKEKELADAKRVGFEQAKMFNQMLVEQAIDNNKAAIAAEEDRAANDRNLMEDKLRRLRALAALQAGWEGEAAKAMDPQAFAAAQAGDKDDARAKRRAAAWEKELKGQQARGAKISGRGQAFLDANAAADAARQAGVQANALQAKIDQAAIDSAKSLKSMEADIKGLAKKLDDIVTSR